MTRARGTLTIVRALPGQGRAHFLPRDQLLEHRDTGVRETVRYAAAHVPFYRDFFQREGIDPREIRGASDLVRLPLVPRGEVLRDPRRFRSDAIAEPDGVSLRSTGTTGEPLNLFHDRRSVLLNVAYSERERAVESILVGKRLRYTRMYLGANAPENVDRVREFVARSSYRPFRPRFRRGGSFHHSRGQTAEAIDAIRPDVLMGSGSFLEAYYRAAAWHGGPTHRPKTILYTWDHMTADGRRLIEETFGIPVISRYSAMESLKIAFFCEERRGFHLHEDLAHVTIVGGDGKEVSDGQPGEIVISNLVNRGSVLLNYRIGDLGRISTDRCVCGRTTRVLVDLEGRASEVIPLEDGTLVGGFGIAVAIHGIPGVLRFQLVQREPKSFELRLSTVDRAAFDRGAAAAASDIGELLRGCTVEPVYVEEIQSEPGRKFQPIVLLDNEPA